MFDFFFLIFPFSFNSPNRKGTSCFQNDKTDDSFFFFNFRISNQVSLWKENQVVQESQDREIGWVFVKRWSGVFTIKLQWLWMWVSRFQEVFPFNFCFCIFVSMKGQLCWKEIFIKNSCPYLWYEGKRTAKKTPQNPCR